MSMRGSATATGRTMTVRPLSQARTGPTSARLAAPLLMLAATLTGSAMAGLIRVLTADMHPFEVVFFRNLFGLIALAPWLWRIGLRPFRTRNYALHGLRLMTNIAAMLLFFTAVTLAPLAQIVSLGFASPLFATLFAIVFLRERVRARRWTALVLGFVGTLLILRPGFQALDAGSLMALGSAAAWALSIIVIKLLSRTESPVDITAVAMVLLTPVSLLPALFVWQWPSPGQWLLLPLLGILGTVGHLAMAQAFQLADTSALMPLDFAKLIWAAAIGFFFFAEVPDVWVWIGGAVVFASTIYIALREIRIRVSSPPPATTAITAPPPT